MKQTRRAFMKTTMSASLVAASRRASVLGSNDRINVGMIGVGGMGFSHLNRLIERADLYGCEVTAVCDVYRRRLNRAKERSGGRDFMDYRELLDHSDIDAVFVATPDHWHSKIAIDAMDANKHVYVEKPMTLTIEQAIEVREAVKKYKKILQVGTNRTADDRFWKAQEVIRDGKVGAVTWAQGGYNRNVRDCAFNVWFPIDESAGPGKSGDDYINWDMWLGHEWDLAANIPWNAEHFFRFRKYWPYNGGVATDLLYHIVAPLLISIVGPKGQYPRRVNAGGGLYVLKDGRDIPDVFLMTADYPGNFTLNLTSVLTNDTSVPTRIYGQYGTIDVDREVTLTGNGDFVREFREKNGGYSQVVLPLDDRPDLPANFFNVIRGGGPLYCDADLGTATMVAVKMAVESYRQNKTLMWDAERESIVA